MPDAAAQSIAALTYSQTQTTTTARTLATEARQSAVGNTTKDEFYLTLNTTATAQVSSFVISGTAAAADTIFAIVTDADNNVFKYIYELTAADTVETAGQKLASLIGIDDDVVAAAAFATGSSTVTLTSATPGRAFTVTTGKTGTIAIANPTTGTANAGTPLKRKVVEATWALDDSVDGYLTLTGVVKFFDGGSVPVQKQVQTTAPYKHPLKIDSIRTEQGG
jgi:cystathionine beta-lyase family protein involved in aluminum resistance